MRKYDYYYDNEPKDCSKYVTFIILVIFSLAITAFALLQVHNFYSDQPTVARILVESFQNSESKDSLNSSNNKFTQNQQINKEESNAERQTRAASDTKTNSTKQKSNTYYEEQTPVIVYSRTDTDSSIANRQLAEVPPKQDTDEDTDSFSNNYQDYSQGSEDYDYFSKQQQKTQQPDIFYRQQHQPPPSYSYYRQQLQESSPSPQYYDDSVEEFSGPNNEQHNTEEARSSPYHDYYRKYPYATPRPMRVAGVGNNKRLADAINNQENRNMPLGVKSKAQQQQQQRDPYTSYNDDYDYTSPYSHSPAYRQPLYTNRKAVKQIPQYRNPSIDLSTEEKQETAPQMDLLTMLKSVKTMWDLYQSFTSSWNTIAERRNREEVMAKQKFKQQQRIRINSKKPPRFNSRKNATATTKNPKKQTTTMTATVAPFSLEQQTSPDEDGEITIKKQSLAKVEPRNVLKGERMKIYDADSLRDKRQASNSVKERTDVGEGRYIKGDPLKGYYDFVITEGSYKFWAAFQVGTAILIIYSTFAAIYYSKVNPLVSDYDYTDYLGGARSLSGGDVDFVDDDEGLQQKAQSKSWFEWLPRSGHSLKFILDAIDKLPTDHAGVVVGDQKDSSDDDDDENAAATEYTDETEHVAEYDNFKELRHTNESHETKTLYDLEQNNKAM